MAVTRKVSASDIQNASKRIVNETINGSTPTPEEPTTPKKTEKTTKEKRVGVNFYIFPNTKAELEDYCIRHELTISAGIKKAICEMLDREKRSI